MFICSAYRPPQLPLSKFIEELNKDLAKIPENAEIVLLGDFNVDYTQRSTDRSRMQTPARAHSIEQIVTSPTRIMEKRNQ
jgi:endonuclease/exonuclease/phosphatase family metal-dependent hydrolase